MSFIGLLRTLEQITRTPRMGHDVDVEDGAEQLAEREAEEEVSEPRNVEVRVGFAGCGRDMESYAEGFNEGFAEAQRQQAPDWEPYDDDTDTPAEPGLTPDELVGVRGLLQERYSDQSCTCPSWGNPNWPHRHGCPATGADPAPSPTIVQSAPPPTVDGEGPPADSGIPPSPAGGRSTSRFTAGYLAAVDLIEYKAQGDRDLADMLPNDHAVDPAALRKSTEWVRDTARYMRAIAPTSPASPRSEDAVAEWIGEAVPVISAVLAEHRPAVDYTGVYCNTNSDDGPHDHYENWAAWRAHVGPLIANALAPQDK